MPSRFIQIHTLTSYPSALLNRDDAGFAKRIPFGGFVRTRVSSQCLKRHWRTFNGHDSIPSIIDATSRVSMSVRSRQTFAKYVFDPLVADGIAPEIAGEVTRSLIAVLLGKSAKAEAAQEADIAKKKAAKGVKETEEVDILKDERESVFTSQVTVIGRPEIDYILSEARAVVAEIDEIKKAKAAVDARLKAIKANVTAMKRAAGLDAALFGRMVTSDILARGDAAIHVAHAFTTHAEADETDYFSAVDDLLAQSEDGGLGSGHINTAELTSGLYYGYVVVDVPLLVSNIEGCARADWMSADRRLSAEIARRLTRIVATVSPGAKLGSTAPYAYADLVMVEFGNEQPRTLANAFLNPVTTSPSRPDLLRNSFEALERYVATTDAMYESTAERRVAARGPIDAIAPLAGNTGVVTLGEATTWIANRIEGA